MPDTSAGLTHRARLLLPLLLAALVVLSIHRLHCAPALAPYQELAGPTMGTTYSVKIATPSLSADELRRIGAAVAERLEVVNRKMSTYIEDSELSLFNASAAGAPFPVSAETLEVFEIARQVSELSGGAFDITVGPLVAAWGFGATDRPPGPPPAAERAEIMRYVGYHEVRIDRAASTLAKDDPRTRCDLSAIAKGYAVDSVSELLAELGHRSHLVEIGGELRASGRRTDGRAWRVAIERPEDGPQRSVQEILDLEAHALATSGDYRNYYEQQGMRFSHTIDPRTGSPIEHRLASVSVLHPRAVWADALATALNVLGPEEGYDLAVSEGIAAFFIVRDPGSGSGAAGFTLKATPAFRALHSPPDAQRSAAADRS